MTGTSKAVFLSYASQDTEAVRRIADTLRAGAVEVWFDQNELRGGDAWDRQIRKQINDCALFVPIISAHTEARSEGYFRREWRLAVERTHDIADDTPFLIPVSIDNTPEASARVPDQFHHLQWTRLPDGMTPPAFVERISRLLSPEPRDIAKPNFNAVAPLAPPRASSLRVRQALLLLLGVAVLSVAYLAVDKFVPTKRGSTPVTAIPGPLSSPTVNAQKSIAVLPFIDLSEKHDQEYFSDGLSEELIDHLARSATLSVISRTSCFYFKGKQATVGDIAKTLNVTHVLEGSVRKAGNALRITVQLIRASDGIHLWSRTYDRTLRDIFKLQDEIANEVEKELKVTNWNSPESAGHSPSPAAYNLVLLARSFRSFNLESFDKSIQYYRQAIMLDPDYALAWAGLSMELTNKQQLTAREETQVLRRQARDAAEKALAIDPTLAAAHVAAGFVREDAADWNEAQREFEKANALKPESGAFPLVLLRTWRYGALSEAIDFYQTAVVRDPLDTTYFTKLGQALRDAGRFEEAATAFRRVIQIDPTFDGEHGELAATLLQLHQPEDALIEAQKEHHQTDKDFIEAKIYWAMGRRAAADAALETLKAALGKGVNSADIAQVLSFRGDIDAAFEWLDRAFRENDLDLPMLIKIDLDFTPLRQDPRYGALLHKLNLPA